MATFRFLPIAAAALMLLPACSEKTLFEPSVPDEGKLMSLSASVNGDDTKTVFEQDGAAYKVKWEEEGESLAVVELSSVGGTEAFYKVNTASRYSLTTPSSALFSFSMPEKTADNFDYYYIYPSDAYYSTSVKNSDITFKVPSTQTPTTTGPDHFATVLWAAETGFTSQPDQASAHFSHLTAYAKMTIKNLPLSGEKISSVVLKASGKKIAGNFYHYWKTGQNAAATGTSDEIMMKTNELATTSGTFDCWMGCFPFSMAVGEKLIISVNTDKGQFQREVTLTKALNFQAGHASSFSVDMSSATKKEVDFYDITFDSSASGPKDVHWTSKDVKSLTHDGITWNTSIEWQGSSSYVSSSEVQYCQLGSKSGPAKSITISTSGFAGKVIKSVSVKCNCMSNTGPTVTVTAGSTTMLASSALQKTTPKTHKTTSAEVALGSGDLLTVSFASTAQAAICLYEIDVEYEDGEIVVVMPKITTGAASNIGCYSAKLSASYKDCPRAPYDIWFEIGTSQANLNRKVYYNDVMPGTQGSVTVDVDGLSPVTKYYYRAVMQVGEEDYFGDVMSFTTLDEEHEEGSTLGGRKWLELPAVRGDEDVLEALGSGKSRNYSYYYNKTYYTAMWSAYPLCKSHTSGSASSSWAFNPNTKIGNMYQIDVKSNAYGTNYNAGSYARGHQVPNADRKSDSNMNKQVYYLTNQTPQLQNKFNGSIWSSLENTIRTVASATDTVYVVTGASFQKVGGSETINYLTAAKSDVYPKKVPVPNYYWKVLLKVKRSGSTITSAQAIGVWLQHKEYSSSNWQSYVVSVDTIEEYTGFNFFVNLPDELEVTAESNTSWNSFYSF